MLTYRPDIDGLRAIAVASVVLYHLQETWLPGGFVGVDIFFVISGYLITKLIHSELVETGAFSFKHFYVRRIRRLLPALLATFVFCMAFAYWLFSPTHLIEFAQSLVAAIFSVSNIFFWNLSDYFDADVAFKPLLHTWSLSVEEQFYLIWPALLTGLFAIKRKSVIPIVVLLLGLASLLLNIALFSDNSALLAWLTPTDSETTLSAAATAFYWLPFRVFEFVIGALLVWTRSPQRRILAEGLFAIGLVMVLSSFFLLNSKMIFPSVTALTPTLGAALMIYSGAKHRLSWIVSNRGMVGLGLISYSLYLIHWPMIVFYSYWIARDLTLLDTVLLIVVSVLFAYLMVRYIEQPFRKIKVRATNSNSSPNRPFLLASTLAALLTVAISLNAVTSKGWLWRYPADVVAQLSYQKGDYTDFFWANIKRLESGFENDDRNKVLIIGDSMAADLVNVLIAADADHQLDIAAVIIGDNCKSLFGFSSNQYQRLYGGAATRCEREHARVLEQLHLFKAADSIVLASHLWHLNQVNAIPRTVAHLKSLTKAKVMVLGSKVQINNGIHFVSRHVFTPQSHELRTPPHPKTVEINTQLKELADDYIYFDLLDRFCNTLGCQRLTKDGYVIIFDENHLSESGAKFLAQDIHDTDWFQHLLSSN